jgi:hypothetical protein
MYSGRFAGELTVRVMVNPQLATPEAPTPARARPTMNISEEYAAPQTTLPTRKMAKKPWYTQRREKTDAILPARGMRAHVVRE